MNRVRDVVVPCDGKGHRVRLRGGLRYLSRARCPTCGAPVDPFRWRRVVQSAANMRRPASEAALDRAAWAIAMLALLLAGGMALVLWGLSDVWWPATVLLYGPRWTLLVPFVPAAAFVTWRDPGLLAPLVLGALVTLGPVMGFRTGWRALWVAEAATDITVATFNVAGGENLWAGAYDIVDRLDADVIGFQECAPGFARALAEIPGRSTHFERSLCLSTRFEILGTTTMDRSVLESVGGSGLVTTYSLATPDGAIMVTNVHLDTPRAGLELIRSGRLSEGIRRLREKSTLREIELRQAERQARQAGPPGIALGDFNTPPESRAYRAEWRAWRNAFSVAGFGFGGTRLNGWIRARIDHVILDDSWTIVDSWLGPDVGSDHLPLVARVRLAQTGR